MAVKVAYWEETLKRLPLILLCGSGLWYGITKLNSIESKIEKIELLSFKDKEAIDSKLNDVQLLTQNNSNRTTEIEKDVIRLLAIVPTFKLKIEDENNN